MSIMQIVALALFGGGMLALGVSIGEANILRLDRRAKIRHATDPYNVWWFGGVVAIGIAAVLAIIASFPPEKVMS